MQAQPRAGMTRGLSGRSCVLAPEQEGVLMHIWFELHSGAPMFNLRHRSSLSQDLGEVVSGYLVLAAGDKELLFVCLSGNGWPKSLQLLSLWPSWGFGPGSSLLPCRVINQKF